MTSDPTIATRVATLRTLMAEHDLDAYLIPSTDEHQNEYVPHCWKRRQYISGFTGSAGDVLITPTMAGLWTDGRYHIQAAQQLDAETYTLFKLGLRGTDEVDEYLVKTLARGQRLGLDPKVVSIQKARELMRKLKPHGIECVWVEPNLVDEVWTDQPPRPTTPVRVHPEAFAGATVGAKLDQLREKLADEDASAHILAALDTIAWLFNIRGSDIDYNPLVISYAIVTATSATLFVDPEKIDATTRTALAEVIDLRPYDEFEAALVELGDTIGDGRVWLDKKSTSQWVRKTLQEHGADRFCFDPSPVVAAKAVKNEVEIAGMRAALVRDGVAMVRFLAWVDREVATGRVAATEQTLADRLEAFRAEGDHFQSLSFETISGFGGHGAIIHYAVTPETDRAVEPPGIYIVDSGGQYLDGTTDITRTVAIGDPTDDQRAFFTRVLQGHIALAQLRFPKGTCGKQLELAARKPLWDAAVNYRHGTGHGIGAHLNVHEGPQSISPRDTGVDLEPGMICSNEPGYYEADAYGIRIENLILCVTIDEDPFSSSEYGPFYGFETLTLCPIDLALVKPSIMTAAELAWLNAYHTRVYETLAPLVDDEDRGWLRRATRTL